MSLLLKVEISRVDVATGKVQRTTDYVAEEEPLHIFLNRTYHATIFSSPSNLKELAVGHVISEGIVKSIDEIVGVKQEEGVCHIKLHANVDLGKRLRLLKHISRVILTSCGSRPFYTTSQRLPKVETTLKVKAETIVSCVSGLNTAAETFRKTGGVHAAAIYDAVGTRAAFAEDVGRHNAVDKVVGIATLEKINLRRYFLALTGRCSSDIILKAARVRLPIVASMAAPLDLGISVASKTNQTLIGFVRGKRMNVYTFPERILL